MVCGLCRNLIPCILCRSITAAAKEMDTANKSITKVVRFTVAHEMTVYEISIWIWTLGWNNRWPDAKVYSESFFKNEITGDLLSSLSLSMLEIDLGIQNLDHCMAIKNYIDCHFQETNLHKCGVPMGIGSGEESQRSSVSLDHVATCTSTMRISRASEANMADSVFNSNPSLFGCQTDS